MIHIPDIINYKPFYIQAEEDEFAIDTTEWGLVAKSNPYPLLPTPKQPYKNDWFDEHGDDEYCSEMYYEAFEFTVTMYIKAIDDSDKSAEVQIREKMDDFFAKVGKGEFKVFDAYTGLGRQKVRYAGYGEESFIRRKDWARAIFTITFKVNDPITRIVLRDSKLVEE